MKKDLEFTPGFSVKYLFNLLDMTQKQSLPPMAFYSFMLRESVTFPKCVPTDRRVLGIMRRINLPVDGKFTFVDFSKFLRPVQVSEYMDRLEKFGQPGDRRLQFDLEQKSIIDKMQRSLVSLSKTSISTIPHRKSKQFLESQFLIPLNRQLFSF